MRAESEEMSHMEQLEVGIESTEEECWGQDKKSHRDYQVGLYERGDFHHERSCLPNLRMKNCLEISQTTYSLLFRRH